MLGRESGKDVYLSFTATSLSDNAEDVSNVSFIFYKDRTASFSLSPKEVYHYKESEDGGFILVGEDKTIYTDFHRASASHYFFLKNGTSVLKFACQDANHVKSLPEGYKPHYEAMAAATFTGPGLSAGKQTTGSIAFINDEMKTVYYAPQGLEEISTTFLNIGYGWEKEGDDYSFTMDDIEYASSLNDERVPEFKINSVAYTLNAKK